MHQPMDASPFLVEPGHNHIERPGVTAFITSEYCVGHEISQLQKTSAAGGSEIWYVGKVMGFAPTVSLLCYLSCQ